MSEESIHLHEIGEQLAALKGENEEAHKSYQRRIKALEEGQSKQTEMLLAIRDISNAQKNIVTKMTSIDGKVDKLDKRIDVIEKEPGDKWKKLAFEITKYIVLAAVGVAVGYIIKGA